MLKSYKLLFLNIIIISLFLGCTPPSAFSFFKKDKLKANALQYTKTVKLVKDGQVETVMNVTYLNPVNDDFDDETQNFIVGVFMSNNSKNYKITMNDRDATYSSKLSEQHKMYGHIPFYNEWEEYYLMKFDTIENEETLNLTFKNTDSNATATVQFEVE